MERRKARRESGPFMRDPAWDDPTDMWGIGFGAKQCRVPRRNPVVFEDDIVQDHAPVDASRVLQSYGFWLSTNPKTILSVNFPNGPGDEYRGYGTCVPSKWCRKNCYGLSVNCQEPQAMTKYISNAEFLHQIDHLPARVLDDVVWAIKTIALRTIGIDAIRWNGIGDLTPEVLPLLDALTADGTFVIYGFTRRGRLLQQLPVRDNLVIWCSMDETMLSRLDEQLAAAEHHQTALAFVTDHGLATSGRSTKPPWVHGRPYKKQEAPGPDPVMLRLLADPVTRPSVCFGYHGSGRMTRALVNEYNEPVEGPECPGTDPFGGGHFKGACVECGWCLQKPANRVHRTLEEHRQTYVLARPFKTKGVPRIEPLDVLLDDGSPANEVLR